ncbi:hypothetical protein [Zhihengliuella halotolerans]|uniref:hypothetical protein n=1 Tax=Zhihengliuella halotolerans TaxID=370736 RepID=UPI000C80DAF2|nr:hypothetical protein [Zhihengliuella halotolerans]
MAEPAGLGERGAALWKALKSKDVARNALALEAARTADRLDELDNVIQGKGVLNLMRFRVLDLSHEDDGSVSYNIEVKFQNVLSEARQQQTTFANVLSKLGLGDTAAKPAEQKDAPALPSNVSPLDRARNKMKA